MLNHVLILITIVALPMITIMFVTFGCGYDSDSGYECGAGYECDVVSFALISQNRISKFSLVLLALKSSTHFYPSSVVTSLLDTLYLGHFFLVTIGSSVSHS